MKPRHLIIPTVLTLAHGIGNAAPTYAEDVAFLKKNTPIIELADGQARVAIAPAYQGRVMTSSATGSDGAGIGWINPDVIAAGIKPEAEREGLARHIHVFGGEERLWFGPEGGPFSLFFPAGAEQKFENWKTPAVIDTEAFRVIGEAQGKAASFGASIKLPNRKGTVFSMEVERSISLAPQSELAQFCGGKLPDRIKAVAYTTRNTVKNTGTTAWTKVTGAPSIWILGMYKPTPRTTIVVPFVSGDESVLGAKATTNYFGKIPANRITLTDSRLFFKGDGTERGKLGISPKRSKGLGGSWQPDSGVLTLVKIHPSDNPLSKDWPYVDSQWREDVDPFGGDVMNSYNDGPPEPGAKALGPFYELETSSPALFLKPGEAYCHTQTTIHLTGARAALDAISKGTLGVGLEVIEKALP